MRIRRESGQTFDGLAAWGGLFLRMTLPSRRVRLLAITLRFIQPVGLMWLGTNVALRRLLSTAIRRIKAVFPILFLPTIRIRHPVVFFIPRGIIGVLLRLVCHKSSVSSP